MMIEVFKTNVGDEATAEALKKSLHALLPLASVNFDLEDCDKILRVQIHLEKLQELVKVHLEEKNVYCEVLE